MLYEAIDQSRAKPPIRDKLILWCKTSKHIANLTETIGLMHHGFELNPTSVNYNLNIEIIKYMLRAAIHTRFQKEFDIYRAHVDKVLAFGFTQLRAKGWEVAEFWRDHQALVALVVPSDSVERLLKVSGSWIGHERDIDAVTTLSNSVLGEKMFGYARVASASHRTGALVQNEINRTLDGVDLTMEIVNDARNEISKKLKAECGQCDLDSSRVVELSYIAGERVKVNVANVWEELGIRLDLYVKLAALNSHLVGGTAAVRQLVSLFCELDLFPMSAPQPRLVEADLLVAYNSCRKSANARLTATRQQCGEQVSEFFGANLETLLMIDPSIKVEKAFFEKVYAESAKTYLMSEMLRLLPEQPRDKPLADVLLALEQLKEHGMFKFANDAAKADAKIVIEWVRALTMASQPSFKAVKHDEGLRVLQARLAYLIVVEQPGSASEAAKVLFGQQALTFMMNGVDAKITAGEDVDLTDVKIFDTFGWLLSELDIARQRTWIQKIFAKATTASPGSIASVPKKITHGALAPKTDNLKKAKHSTTMDLFKKKV